MALGQSHIAASGCINTDIRPAGMLGDACDELGFARRVGAGAAAVALARNDLYLDSEVTDRLRVNLFAPESRSFDVISECLTSSARIAPKYKSITARSKPEFELVHTAQVTSGAE